VTKTSFTGKARHGSVVRKNFGVGLGEETPGDTKSKLFEDPGGQAGNAEG